MNDYDKWKYDLSSFSHNYIRFSTDINTIKEGQMDEEPTLTENVISQSFGVGLNSSSFDFGSFKTQLEMIPTEISQASEVKEEVRSEFPTMERATLKPFSLNADDEPTSLKSFSVFPPIPKKIEIEYVIPSFGKNYADAIKFNRRVKYPYLSFLYDQEQIAKIGQEIETTQVVIDRKIKPLYNFKQSNTELSFNGRYYNILPSGDNSSLVAEYFNESQIVNCLRDPRSDQITRSYYFNTRYPSIIRYFIENDLEVEPSTLRDYIDRFGPKKCHSFRPSAMKHLIEVFKAKKVLDVSAGWGDRLVGTIASNAEAYYAYDPNSKLFEGYTNIIEFFGKDIDYNIESVPFETATPPSDFFDLAIACLQSFDMEIYVNFSERDAKFQSTYRMTEREWYKYKIKVWLNKCHDSLKDNGVLCVNITSYKGTSYVKWLLSDMSNDPKWKRLGTINYVKEQIYKNDDVNLNEPIFIWQKISKSKLRKVEKEEPIENRLNVITDKEVGDNTRFAYNTSDYEPIYPKEITKDYLTVLKTLKGIETKRPPKYKSYRESQNSRRILKRVTPKIKRIDLDDIDDIGDSLAYIDTKTTDNDEQRIFVDTRFNSAVKIIESKKFSDGNTMKIHKNPKGEYDGKMTLYTKDGYILMDTNFKNDVMNGWRHLYNTSPPYEKISSEHFIFGNLDEKITYFNMNENDKNFNGQSSIRSRITYDDNGYRKDKSIYDKNGSLLYREYNDYYQKYYINSTYDSHTLQAEKFYTYNDELIKEIIYDEDGKVIEVKVYIDDLEQQTRMTNRDITGLFPSSKTFKV